MRCVGEGVGGWTACRFVTKTKFPIFKRGAMINCVVSCVAGHGGAGAGVAAEGTQGAAAHHGRSGGEGDDGESDDERDGCRAKSLLLP